MRLNNNAIPLDLNKKNFGLVPFPFYFTLFDNIYLFNDKCGSAILSYSTQTFAKKKKGRIRGVFQQSMAKTMAQ